VAPLLVFGFLFFPSATERWVLILPCTWLAAAVALAAVRRRVVLICIATFLIGVPAALNVFTVAQERALDRRTLERSHAVTALLRDGDTLLFPGHTWDEYVGFYEDARIERFILASFGGEERGNRDALLQRLRDRIDATHRRGNRVLSVRVLDAQDSHHGWSLLRAMGISRDDVLIVLAGYGARRLARDPVGVWEILPVDQVELAADELAADELGPRGSPHGDAGPRGLVPSPLRMGHLEPAAASTGPAWSRSTRSATR
jgi:hypothetical protein